MQQSELISLKGISKQFTADRTILHDLHFNISPGECVAIFGPSGSGKSTLLNILGLIISPDAGEMYFNSNSILQFSENQLLEIRREQVGFIFQNFRLLSRLNVLENVMSPLLLRGYSNRIAKTRSEESLNKLGLSSVLDQFPATLSGGEQQRVAIARAIVSQPSLIIADEPTGSLDTTSGEVVLKLLRSFTDAGTAIVMATHSTEAAKIADSIYTLSDGKLVRQ